MSVGDDADDDDDVSRWYSHQMDRSSLHVPPRGYVSVVFVVITTTGNFLRVFTHTHTGAL